MTGTQRSPGEPAATGLGVTVHPLSGELTKQFELKVTQGVVIVAVDKSSCAARQGIKPGDVIISINQRAVTSSREFRDACQGADLKKGVTVKWASGSTTRVQVLKEGAE